MALDNFQALRELHMDVKRTVEKVSPSDLEQLMLCSTILDEYHHELRLYMNDPDEAVRNYAHTINEGLCSFAFRILYFMSVLVKKKKEESEEMADLISRTDSIVEQQAWHEKFLFDANDVVKGKALGSGAFGKVFAGTCFGTQVAIKVAHKKILSREERMDFLEEVSNLRKIQSPFVVHFYGACLEDENIMIVSELMKCDFRKAIENKIITTNEEILSVFLDVAQGMLWLKNVYHCIHRDIKPENILLDWMNHGKLTDFGFATILKNDVLISTPDDEIRGTKFYLAPEALEQKPLSHASDIFALSMVIYFAYAKKTPLDDYCQQGVLCLVTGAFIDAICHKHIRPNAAAVNMPPRMRMIMEQCWQHDPADRPTHEDVFQAFSLALMDETLPPPESGPLTGILDIDVLSEAGRFWSENFCTQDIVTEVPLRVFEKAYHQTADMAPLDPKLLTKCGIKLFNGEPIVTLQWFRKMWMLHGLWFVDADMSNMLQDLLEMPWFHGKIDSEVADARLVSGKEGDFLVRYSQSQPAMAIHFIQDGKMRHYRVTLKNYDDFDSMYEMETSGHVKTNENIIDLILRCCKIFRRGKEASPTNCGSTYVLPSAEEEPEQSDGSL